MDKTVYLENVISEFSKKNKNLEEYPVYSVTNEQGFCRGYFSKEVASKDLSNYKIVPRGYFAYNPSRINVGSIDWQREEDNVIVSPLYVVFKTSDEILQQYLLYYLKSEIALSYIKNSSSGSVRDNLKFSTLTKFSIKLPEINEQQKIVDVLDRVAGLINNAQSRITYFDTLIKSRFIEMFGEPADNPKKWNVKPFLDMGYCKNGMNFHIGENGTKIHCLGVGDFKNHSIIADTEVLPTISLNEFPPEEYLLKNNDIVFVRSNGNKALVGRCLVVYPNDIATTFSGFCIRYRMTTSDVLVQYLLYVLKSESIRRKMAGRGVNIQNLNQKTLSTLLIPIPPIDLQNEFSQFVESTNRAKQIVQQQLEELETLKKSLMQKYFG